MSKKSNEPKYTLVYFDAKARAEVSRLLLAYKGREYTDKRVEQAEWPKEKPSTPFGQLPVLKIGDECFGQSHAIARYLARDFGMAGENNLEQLRVDQIVELTGDLFPKMTKAFFEKDETEKAKLKEEMIKTELPKFLGFFEKAIADNNKRCKDANVFVGKSFTLADFAVFNILDIVLVNFPAPLDKFPLVQKLQNSIKSDAKIAKYLKERKTTPF